MIKLHYITNGDMKIELENMTFGKHEKDPVDNVKSFICKDKEISLVAENMRVFTNWGTIEVIPQEKKIGVIHASIDSDSWGWVATAQIMIEKDSQIMINDNFQSGLKGPVGDPKKTKSYPIPIK